MNDDDLLRGYRPADPPPELRARITSATRRAQASAERPGLRDWLPAIAAAGLIVILQVLAAGIRDRVYDQIDVRDTPPQIEVPNQ
jgi:hypothetical protein